MFSVVETEQLETESFEAAEAALDSLLAEDACFANSREAIARLEAVERIRRKAAALAVQCQRELASSRVYCDDEHASPKVMARHVAKLSNGEAAGLEKQARMSGLLPQISAALGVGTPCGYGRRCAGESTQPRTP